MEYSIGDRVRILHTKNSWSFKRVESEIKERFQGHSLAGDEGVIIGNSLGLYYQLEGIDEGGGTITQTLHKGQFRHIKTYEDERRREIQRDARTKQVRKITIKDRLQESGAFCKLKRHIIKYSGR